MLPLRMRLVLFALVASPAGSAAAQTLVIALPDEDRVLLVDAATTRTLATVPVGRTPHEITVSRDGRLAFVADAGGPAAPNSATVTVIDVVLHARTRTLELGPACVQPHDVRVNDTVTTLWVACAPGRNLTEVDLASGSVRTRWPLPADGAWMLDAAADGATLVAAHLEGRGVTIVTRETGRTRFIDLGASQLGLDIAPDGREVWVSSADAGTLHILDLADGSVRARFDAPGRGPVRLRFTPDGRSVVVVHADDRTVAVLDRETRSVRATVTLPHEPKVLALSDDGGTAWVTHPADSAFSVVDLVEGRLFRVVRVEGAPDGIAFAPAGPAGNGDAQEVSLPMRMVRGRPVVDVTVDGSGPFPFILDTGAMLSLMDAELAAGLGLADAGRAMIRDASNAPPRSVALRRAREIGLGDVALRDVRFLALEDTALFDAIGVRGVLGVMPMAGRLVVFDFAAGRLELIPGALAEGDGSLPWSGALPIPGLPIDVAGHTVVADVDTGNGRGLALPRALLDSLTLATPLVADTARMISGAFEILRARLAGTVRIGDVVLQDPDVHFQDRFPQANVGASVLAGLRLIVDPAERRLWLGEGRGPVPR